MSQRNIKFFLRCHISKRDMCLRAIIFLLDMLLKTWGSVNLYLEEVKDMGHHPLGSVITLNLQIRIYMALIRVLCQLKVSVSFTLVQEKALESVLHNQETLQEVCLIMVLSQALKVFPSQVLSLL